MKRTLAVICSSVLALSIAPLASAAIAPATVASGNVVGVTIDAPIFERVARKACSIMCVQSTLQEIDHAAYFVNDNTGLLSFSNGEVTLRNLDTGESRSEPFEPGFTGENLMTAISNDEDEVYIFDTDRDGAGHVFRVDTRTQAGDDTLVLVDVTPENPTHSLAAGTSIRGLAVAPNNSGYFYIYRQSADRYACHFDENGIEVACSEGFGGSAETSGIFTNSAGSILFVMGDGNKRFAFDVEQDLELSYETIPELTGKDVNFELGTQTNSGDMVFVDRYDPTKRPAETSIYSIHMDGKLIDSHTISGNLALHSIFSAAGTNLVFLLGIGSNSQGSFNSYDSLFQFRANPTYYPNYEDDRALKLLKHLKLKPRGGESPLTKLTVDDLGRYLIAFGEGTTSKVIPLKRPTIEMFGEMHDDNDNVFISWDFIDLVPRKSVTSFRIEFKADGSRKWRVVHNEPATGVRTLIYGPVVRDGVFRVVPVGIKLNKKDIDTWSVNPPSGG